MTTEELWNYRAEYKLFPLDIFRKHVYWKAKAKEHIASYSMRRAQRDAQELVNRGAAESHPFPDCLI